MNWWAKRRYPRLGGLTLHTLSASVLPHTTTCNPLTRHPPHSFTHLRRGNIYHTLSNTTENNREIARYSRLTFQHKPVTVQFLYAPGGSTLRPTFTAAVPLSIGAVHLRVYDLSDQEQDVPRLVNFAE